MAAWTSSTGTGCVFLCIVRQPPGSGLFPPLGYFRKKEKHLLASLPKREAAPCAFAEARPPTQADWPAGKSFQFLSQFTTSHRYVLSIFVETPPFFSFHAVGGNVPCLCTIQPPTRWQLGCSRRRLFLGSVDEKDTRYKRGHKNFRIKKNLRCANCSPQVWWTQRDSNPRPLGCEPNALPAELWAQKCRLAYQAAFIF